MADKLTRKELLKKDDAFLAAAGESAKWLTEHRTQVIAGSVAVVAVLLGIWGLVEYQGKRDHDASALFNRGLQLLDAAVLPPDSKDAPKPDDADAPTFANDTDKLKAVRDQFQKVVDQAGSSGVATLALFVVADTNQKLGDKEAAERQFVALADRLAPKDSLHFLASERAAYLQEARGDTDGALKSLGRVANVQGGFYRDYATFHQARLYAAKGETERARNLFERIEKEFPESSVLDKARDRLNELPSAPRADVAPPSESGSAK